MSTLLSLLLMVGVVVGLRWLTRRRSTARRSSLLDIASQLGLHRVELDALGTPVQDGTAATSSRPSSATPRPLADGLTAAWGTGVQLHGAWNGRDVSIGALPARRYRIAVAARCHLPRELGLHVSGRNGPAILPSDARGTVTIDDALDRQAHLHAKDPAGATSLLERTAVRQALSALLADDATVVVSDDWVYVTPYHDRLGDAAAARAALDAVTRMADALDRALAQE